MEIKYSVNKNEMVCGSVSVSEFEEFFTVDAAIEYHKKQEDGSFNWWDITVEYEDE